MAKAHFAGIQPDFFDPSKAHLTIKIEMVGEEADKFLEATNGYLSGPWEVTVGLVEEE